MHAIQSTVVLDNPAAKRLLQGAPWFFERDCIGRTPRMPGIARVFDKRGRFLASAFISPGSRYFLRVITKEDVQIDRAFWRERIVRADRRRKKLLDLTDAYRVVFSESDGIPGVVIDRYNDIISIQITSSGAAAIRDELVGLLVEIFNPASIIEKGEAASRKAEGLPLVDSLVYGEKQRTIVREGDQLFDLDVMAGQKSGAYLDYRGFRLKAREFARGDCLDAFCYQGWFSCHISRLARNVVALDSSRSALDQAAVNARLNKHGNIEFVTADAFEYLKTCDRVFDFVHVDPPAMAKEHSKLAQAVHGYKKLITNAIRLLREDGVLMISSCSHKISERILEEALIESSKKSKRKCEVVWRGIQDIDHPVMRGLPESLYLKAIAARVC